MSLLQDLKYTFRTLGKDALFTTFAVLIIGLGIGASTTLFSVVNTLLLRPLPFKDPGRLAWVTNYKTGGLSGATTQVGIFQDIRTRNQSFSDMAAYFAFYGVGDNVLSGKGEPERLSGVPVSREFLSVAGRRAADREIVHARRMQMERSEGGDAQPRVVGEALCVGSGNCGPRVDAGQWAGDGGGGDAGVV